jgi:hypothetical protein
MEKEITMLHTGHLIDTTLEPTTMSESAFLARTVMETVNIT